MKEDKRMAVRVAVVGCGAIGTKTHVPGLLRCPEARIVAFCDSVESRARDCAAKHGGVAFSDFEAMLRHDDLDAVVLGVPNYLHAPMTIAALEAGKDVLVEKPMATTREEARAMIAAARASGRLLMVGQSQRYEFAHALARDILASGRLGAVLSFRTCFAHGGPEKWCIDQSPDTWFFRKDQAVMGVCGDLAIHRVDLMRFLLREEIVSVSAEIGTRHKRYADGRLIEVDDHAMLNVRTASGVLGSVVVGWCNYGDWDAFGTTIYCEGGVMLLNANPDAQLIVRYADGSEERHKTARMINNERKTSRPIVQAFVEAIVRNEPSPVDGVEGYRSLNVILAAFESSATGRTIRIDPRLPNMPVMRTLAPVG
jgi:UDP-N-acetylglucosamine 3-dehydrogenase